MGKEVTYKLKAGTALSPEEIAIIEAARNLPVSADEDNPEIDPIKTPALYEALMQAVAQRNKHMHRTWSQPG